MGVTTTALSLLRSPNSQTQQILKQCLSMTQPSSVLKEETTQGKIYTSSVLFLYSYMYLRLRITVVKDTNEEESIAKIMTIKVDCKGSEWIKLNHQILGISLQCLQWHYPGCIEQGEGELQPWEHPEPGLHNQEVQTPVSWDSVFVKEIYQIYFLRYTEIRFSLLSFPALNSWKLFF